MKLENLKHDLPETPDFIHQMIVSEVDRQVKQEKTVKMRSTKRKHWSFGKIAAVAACAALAVSTIVYAGTSLYRIYTEKKGNYGVITIIEEEADQSITLPEQIPKLKLQPNYIPEGMEWKDDESKWCLDYTDGQGGFSFSVLLLDQPYNDAQMVDTNVVETETRSFGRYEGTYLRMNDLGTTGNIGYNQTFYLFCPEEYQILIANVSSNVSKEEAYRVMENLELTETGEMMETADVYGRWSNYVCPETEIEESQTFVQEDKMKTYTVGEAVSIQTTGEDENGETVFSSDITAVVDQVQVSDDLSLLKEERIPEEWKSAIGEDGKLVQNELSYIKKGDGVDTLDEIAFSEMENQKLVAVDVTYTNTGEMPLKHILYIASIMTAKQEAGAYKVYDFVLQPGEDYDYVSGKSVAAKTTMDYYDPAEDYGNGGNYIASLDPGESMTVRMAWIVNERELPDLYLDLATDGNGMEFVEDTQLVDIRQW